MSSSITAPSSSANQEKFSMLSICSKVTLDGSNYSDWLMNIKLALHYEDKEYVLDKEFKELDEAALSPEEYVEYKKAL